MKIVSFYFRRFENFIFYLYIYAPAQINFSIWCDGGQGSYFSMNLYSFPALFVKNTFFNAFVKTEVALQVWICFRALFIYLFLGIYTSVTLSWSQSWSQVVQVFRFRFLKDCFTYFRPPSRIWPVACFYVAHVSDLPLFDTQARFGFPLCPCHPHPLWQLLVPTGRTLFGSWWLSHFWPAAQIEMVETSGRTERSIGIWVSLGQNESDQVSYSDYLLLVSVLMNYIFQEICPSYLKCHIYWVQVAPIL